MSFFETLSDLPLFKGATSDVLGKIVGNYKFNFKKYEPSAKIVNAGEQCNLLIFILSGDVHVTNVLPCGITLKYNKEANSVIAPEFMFGRSTVFPASFEAVNHVSVFEITKADYLEILSADSVFMFNYLNLLSRKAQKGYDFIPTLLHGDVCAKVSAIIDNLTESSDKGIILSPHAKVFPKIFNVSEKEYNDSLSWARREGVIDFDDETIKILDRAAMVANYRH